MYYKTRETQTNFEPYNLLFFKDNSNSFNSILEYIDEQYERYLRDESGLNRRNIIDNRVHCCFYFISPFGHGLKPLDIEFMKKLHLKVNIVPVIAKADMLTKKEINRLKLRILEEIKENGIKIYPLPDCDSGNFYYDFILPSFKFLNLIYLSRRR